ncbi:MAG: thioredoxin family protein [Myxococcota bacterium]
MPAEELTDADFDQRVSGAPMAVVDFHAGWCGPCILFKPKFKRIANEFGQVAFFLVDGEKAPNARKTVKIDDLPFFAVYRDGAFVEGLSTSDEGKFREFVTRHFGAPAAGTP